MLANIHLKNVGPASEMDLNLTDRLNLITGDNGLGKSFLLDIAWWALTRTWARSVVLPQPDMELAEITYSLIDGTRLITLDSAYDPKAEDWRYPDTHAGYSSIVVYARVDGGISVRIPARNMATAVVSEKRGVYLAPSSFHFSPEQIWNGTEFCEGLIRDWASWQREGNAAFNELMSALEVLSPSERLEPGELRRISVSDPKRYPTLRMPYGEEVPVVHVSAGIRRVIALAYILVWAWHEHIEAAHLAREKPTHQVVFLIDEVEAHLHPQWQRRIVPALLNVMDAITGEHKVNVQLIGSTHSPLVMASTESTFDPAKDSWFDLDLDPDTHKVVLQKREYVRLGDYSNWLTSEAFDLEEPRSLEAEAAIKAALAVLRERSPSANEIERVNEMLQASLGGTDEFWLRWSEFYEKAAAAA